MRKIWLGLLLFWWLPAYAHDTNCERNLLAELVTANFKEHLVEVPDIRGQVVKLLADQEVSRRMELDADLTARHEAREMSFQVKNGITGLYDKFVAVEVNSFVAPILKSDFDRMVASTGPLMRLYRQLLQKIYSIPNAGIEDLGFGDLPREEAELALHTIRDSIYLEPALIHPNMAEYPFLAVAGFDGAVVDPKRPTTEFFETNLGTPSGLSNNVQLLHDLLWLNEPLKKLVEPYLPKDDTFQILRKAIESNARAWTGKEGLSVVISPGIYNGAHPDVASIARASGMPLVKSSDLYEDRDGYIRLNTGKGEEDPLVTGIYGRMEESFFLQSNADKIPLISPNFQDNQALSERLGVDLRPGAIYDFIYDDGGKIVGIHRDENGEPKFLEVWDTISEDPSRPGHRGSFAKAIINRKLYYSNIGGRVVDDKRLFRILTSYLLPQLPDMARPIRGLAQDQFDLFYANPSSFVVKEPGNSGGVGIYFPRAMSESAVAELVERVRARPTEFEIQYLSAIATLPAVSQSKSGREVHSEVPIDLRIFVMMDADGNVDAGPNSILLRTGARGGLYTNTSRGGGYGIGLILEDQPGVRETKPFQWAKMQVGQWPKSRETELATVLEQGTALIKCLFSLRFNQDDKKWNECRSQALDLSFAYRQVMDLISPWHLQVIATLRNFAHGRDRNLVQSTELARRMIQSFRRMRQSEGALANVAAPFFAKHARELGRLDPVDLQHLRLPTKAKLRRLDPPEVSYRYAPEGKLRSRKIEFAEYIWVDNPEVQEVIDEVKAFGGQVRLLIREVAIENPEGVDKWFGRESAYFWVNLNPKSPSYLMPVIGIDLAREMSLAALHHEREHFRMLRELYANYRRRGFGHEKAMLRAYAETETEEKIVEAERRAVKAEINAEVEYADHPYNRFFGKSWEANHFYEIGFVNRMTYPEFEGLRRHLRQVKWDRVPVKEDFIRKTFSAAIDFALKTRDQAFLHFMEKDDLASIRLWRESNVFLMLTQPYGHERLELDGIRDDFKLWLSKVCAEMGVSAEDCGVPVH